LDLRPKMERFETVDRSHRAESLGSNLQKLAGLSVFLPAHNEEGNLSRIVQAFRAELPKTAENWEIVIVDDGSTDNTGKIADQLAFQDPHVRVIHHLTNRGYGAAVVSGIRAATQPYILLCDGDGQFEAADIRRLVARICDFDVVVGRRRRRADNVLRRLNGQAWTTLVRLLFRVRISDVDCGFKLFRSETLKDITLQARGAMISTELMARLAARGARVCEVDVNHLPRLAGQQSGNSPKVILRAFKELFLLYRDLRSTIRSRNA
jgi:glycosyltransferase involved in cell wall biosynthesis